MTELLEWQCLDGHNYYISEEAMHQAIVQPRCPIDRGDGHPCGARLARRLSLDSASSHDVELQI